MRCRLGFILFCFLILLSSLQRPQTTIYIIGDSTAAEKKDPQNNPERGWGMMLQGCFSDNVLIRNFAVNGRSSKSFLDEGRWKNVLESLKPGDYVIIQFGHNDSKLDEARHTDPKTTFFRNLERYVLETRSKGAIPVLMSPVARRCFYKKMADSLIDDEKLRNVAYDEEKINSDTLIDTHGAYKHIAQDVAQKLNVFFVDANKISAQIEQKHGVLGSRNLHVWLKPGELSSIPKGRKDNTHYNVYGAFTMANAFADALGSKIKDLRPFVRHYDAVVSSQGHGNYLSLDSALAQMPKKGKYHILVLDGQWRLSKAKLKRNYRCLVKIKQHDFSYEIVSK